MAWYTEGAKTNPANGEVLADSGPLTEGAVTLNSVPVPVVIISSTVNAMVVLQLRNPANDSTVASQGFAVGAHSPFVMPSFGSISLQSGQRLRLVLVGGVTGAMQGSLFL